MLNTELALQSRRLLRGSRLGAGCLALVLCLWLTGCPGNAVGDTDQATGNSSIMRETMQDMTGNEITDEQASASVAEIRREGNHLVQEQSLYLQQHAHNPVDWYPWGDEAIELARRENKLIFLSIGYSSCHWCHVMEEEVFENDRIAALLNEHYICIKVDREERPDIDAVYMTAVQLMSGRGGWPLNVFLTPQLEPFLGVTYVPAARFSSLIQDIATDYRENPSRIAEVAAEMSRTLARDTTPTGPAQGELGDLPRRVMATAWLRFDDEWGGFGSSQKFPTPPRWRFALHYYRLTGDAELARRIKVTLDSMASGGIYDHLGGGFHRYSVDREWVVPHFEKMLYDNAQLTGLYLEAAVVMDSDEYAAIARDTLDFMLQEMHDPAGGFYASFDADSGGEEGTYYSWTPAQLQEVTGLQDGAALARLLGVTETGNFEGANVLTRRSDPRLVAAELDRDEADVRQLFSEWRGPLLEHRGERVPPGLDRKVVTAWNAMAVKALVAGYCYFDDQRYLREAASTAEYLWTRHRQDSGALFRASTGGSATSPAILDDYAEFTGALLELFQATGDARYLTRARELADYTIAHFGHPQAGFYLTADSTPAPLGRQVEIHDSVEPSGNAAMLMVLRDLHALTDEVRYREVLDQALGAYLPVLETSGLDMAAWQDLALLVSHPLHTVVIARDAGTAPDELLQTARALLAPYVLLVPVTGNAGVAAAPLTEGKTALDGRPVAYVCEFGSCQSPTADPAELLRQLREGWHY